MIKLPNPLKSLKLLLGWCLNLYRWCIFGFSLHEKHTVVSSIITIFHCFSTLIPTFSKGNSLHGGNRLPLWQYWDGKMNVSCWFKLQGSHCVAHSPPITSKYSFAQSYQRKKSQYLFLNFHPHSALYRNKGKHFIILCYLPFMSAAFTIRKWSSDNYDLG